jgi:glycosyltransferase involved in cell wall biosynthesis
VNHPREPGQLRILVAADMPEDPDSGAAGSEYQTVCALRALGHEVQVEWSSGLSHRVRHPNLHSLLELPGAYARLLRRAAERAYDVYHFSQVFAYAAAREHRAQRLPGVFVTRSHGYEGRAVEELRAWHTKLRTHSRLWTTRLPGRLIDVGIARASRLAAKWSDGILVSSEEDRDFIMARYQTPGPRVAVIPQAPPPEYHDAPTLPLSTARAQRLLFIGPLRMWKGTHVLRAVLGPLLAATPTAEITLVVPGEDVRSAAALVGVEGRGRVTVLPPMSQGDLMTTFDAHGILLFPSLFEGFGKVVVEAMSRGLCVVASRLGAARIAIEDGWNGRLVAPGDEEGFRGTVAELLGRPDLVMTLGARAIESARAMNWESFARQAVGFYRTLLSFRNGG